jgi:hypothetical protein
MRRLCKSHCFVTCDKRERLDVIYVFLFSISPPNPTARALPIQSHAGAVSELRSMLGNATAARVGFHEMPDSFASTAQLVNQVRRPKCLPPTLFACFLPLSCHHMFILFVTLTHCAAVGGCSGGVVGARRLGSPDDAVDAFLARLPPRGRLST